MRISQLRKFVASQPKDNVVDLNELIQKDLVELSILNFENDVNQWRSELNLISSQDALKILNEQIEYNIHNGNYDQASRLINNAKSIQNDLRKIKSPIYQTNDLPGMISIDRFKKDVFVYKNIPLPLTYGQLNQLFAKYAQALDKAEQENNDIKIFN